MCLLKGVSMSPHFHSTAKTGSLEVICGSMFSGKSEELIRRVRRAAIAKQKTGVFKHSLDNQRSPVELVVSHNGTTVEAFATPRSEDILRLAELNGVEVVGIDEVQFFTSDIVTVICSLIDMGKRVIVAGLDTDFRGVPFGPMPILLSIADVVLKLQAICAECGNNAIFTQRLVDGNPARYDDPLILIGKQEAYQARCRACYRIDKKPHLLEL